MVKSNADPITDHTSVPSLSRKEAMASFSVLFSATASDTVADAEEEDDVEGDLEQDM